MPSLALVFSGLGFGMLARPMMEPSRREPMHFWISHDPVDHAWAEWIAWTSEDAGYRVALQLRDSRPGAGFVREIQKAAKAAQCTIAVLSEDYLAASFARPEWATALAQDAQGLARQLLPVRVAPCCPQRMLGPISHVDLVGLTEDAARAALLDALEKRVSLTREPPFAGASSHELTQQQANRHFARRASFPTLTSGFREFVELLSSMFSEHELRKFVRFLPYGEQLIAALPGAHASPGNLAFETAMLLQRHGLLEAALFARLLEERPHRSDDISRVERLLQACEAYSGSPAPLVSRESSPARPDTAHTVSSIEPPAASESTDDRTLSFRLLCTPNIAQLRDADLTRNDLFSVSLFPDHTGENKFHMDIGCVFRRIYLRRDSSMQPVICFAATTGAQIEVISTAGEFHEYTRSATIPAHFKANSTRTQTAEFTYVATLHGEAGGASPGAVLASGTRVHRNTDLVSDGRVLTVQATRDVLQWDLALPPGGGPAQHGFIHGNMYLFFTASNRSSRYVSGKIMVKQSGMMFFTPNNEPLGALKSFLIRRLLKERHASFSEPDLYAEFTITVNAG